MAEVVKVTTHSKWGIQIQVLVQNKVSFVQMFVKLWDLTVGSSVRKLTNYL